MSKKGDGEKLLNWLNLCVSETRFLQAITVYFMFICSIWIIDSLWPHGLYSPWNSPGQNTGVGSLSLLQGIFPTQGSNPALPHCRWLLYHLSHKGSPGILEWIAYPFSRGSSWSRNRTGVSCIAGGFFTSWAKAKPRNTGVDSLSLLQRHFPTQESNQGHLRCRQLLYQLSY